MDLLQGVRSSFVDTDRIRMRVLEAGPADGEPVVFVHGNLSTSRFFEHLMPELPPRYRVIAPDMRGFGDSDPAPLDATRGLADWADDTAALLRALGVTAPPHLVGWSTGGAAIARYAQDRPVASLTFLDPVSPYGYGGTHPDGTLCFPDGAGSGGGGINPEVVARLRAGDTSADSPFSPRSVFRAFYVAPGYVEPREDLLRRRDPQDPPRRRELPRRRHGVGALAGVRARHVRHPQRALAAVLPLGRHRRPRPQAAGAVDARRRRPGGGRRVAAGAGHARRVGGGAGLAGRGRLPAAADGHPDPHRAGALRRGGRVGAHRDPRRLGARPAPRRDARGGSRSSGSSLTTIG